MACPDCEYHKRRAQIWRHQAYKLGGKPLPWEPNMTDLRKVAEMALNVLLDPKSRADECADAVQTLRQALDYPTPKQIALAQQIRPKGKSRIGQALAQPEHEPWCDSVTKLLLSMPPQIPPCNCKPKREWVEITKGECDELFRAASDHIEYAFAIEAKLKEKNGG